MKIRSLLEKSKRSVKRTAEFRGIPVDIELEIGDIKLGTGPDGEKWQQKMQCEYGYIKNIMGADKEGLDCYVGDDQETEKVFVIHQLKHNGKDFDEDKIIFGINNAEDAKQTWMNHCFNSGIRFGGMCEFDLKSFKKILEKIKKHKTWKYIIAKEDMFKHLRKNKNLPKDFKGFCNIKGKPSPAPHSRVQPETAEDYLQALSREAGRPGHTRYHNYDD